MTEIEIVQKMIKKVKKEGYINNNLDLDDITYVHYPRILNGSEWESYNESVNDFIFDPKFGKAFFGECSNPDGGPLCITHNCNIRDCLTWQDYQYKMLKEVQEGRNPLKYIEKFL